MNNIRNFCIIAHIDHGKSTLADRFLEITKTVPEEKMHPQYLDMMGLEQERGITIKLTPVRMKYKDYILNLIDTPGHVDFAYEVTRSLQAVEGAVLLVDATKGVQAQTIANLEAAQKLGLTIVPVINKIDLPAAEPERVEEQINKVLKNSGEILRCSAKTGEGVEQVLEKIIEKIPPPKSNYTSPLSALIFDSYFDPYLGVVVYVRVMSGKIKAGEKINFFATKTDSLVSQVGVFTPKLTPASSLSAGEIGYIKTTLKQLEKARCGDTITFSPIPASFSPLPGFSIPQPKVFISIFPSTGEDLPHLKEALEKLSLNDSSFSFDPESSSALGSGFRMGFLGLLHSEIILERLKREFGLDLVSSFPSVSYKIIKTNNDELMINNPALFPSAAEIKQIFEPNYKLEIILPSRFVGSVMDLVNNSRAKLIRNEYLDRERLILEYEIPLSALIMGFYDNLKGATSGYASASYQFMRFVESDLVKLEILIAGEVSEAFSQIVHRSQIQREAKIMVSKLKKLIPRQLFEVAIQARVGGKILAREDIPPLRKDVIDKLYGGDRTRKDKLLKKQAAGKKRMKQFGKVEIPADVFLKMFR